MSILKERYNEHQIMFGLTGEGEGLVEIFSSGSDGTWSIAFTAIQNGKRISCLLSAGENLTVVIPEKGPDT